MILNIFCFYCNLNGLIFDIGKPKGNQCLVSIPSSNTDIFLYKFNQHCSGTCLECLWGL